jgi:hypothetical protein
MTRLLSACIAITGRVVFALLAMATAALAVLTPAAGPLVGIPIALLALTAALATLLALPHGRDITFGAVSLAIILALLPYAEAIAPALRGTAPLALPAAAFLIAATGTWVGGVAAAAFART